MADEKTNVLEEELDNVSEEKVEEEISEERIKYLKESEEQSMKLVRENWDRLLENFPKDDEAPDLRNDWIELLNHDLRFLMLAEANTERFEIASSESAMKRSSDLSTADIPALRIPKEEEYRTLIKEVLESIQKSELTEFEIDAFKYRCESALFNIIIARRHYIPNKPDAEKCRLLAKDLRIIFGELLMPRRVLVVLKGYELPAFISKQVDEKDAAKIFADIDKSLHKAHVCILKGMKWCKTEATNPDFKPFAENLDEALASIADADAALKCYQASLGEEDN